MTDELNNQSLFSAGSTSALVELFDALPHVMFCMKGADDRYLAVNDAFVRRSGRTSKREVIGARAIDLFPTQLAERYEEQDALVLATGEPLRNELELIRRPDGSFGWYMTVKLPVMEGS
ncbi:MAG: PAS domain-containing protein, partial [Actinobacteria bacterium]|nr:PAS domain-containing protein [Actinomycetota bacterium]MBT5504474.1 PAS domain-containing protein [Actinomycetota bacterium]MBT6971462.1 PAS domain-containing protein [Actinomycetota bacterium]MBT7470951.1 PAS domain-containing protein [Actinomycetota bacterium]